MTQDRTNVYSVGFVPFRMEVENRPELSDFPKNVCFASFYKENGVDMAARVLYRPDLNSYSESNGEKSLRYVNPYSGDNILTITRNEKGWTGIKKIKDKIVLYSCGCDWGGFFGHLTMNGLTKGEHCTFEKLPKPNHLDDKQVLTEGEIQALEKQHPNIVAQINRFENMCIPACSHCGSGDTANVQVGIVGRTILIAAHTKKFKLVPNGSDKKGEYFCNSCEKFFNSGEIKTG